MSVQLVIPALTFRKVDGTISTTDTERYARRAAATWGDLFILSGTTTNGHTATTAERAATIDIWTAVIIPERITACCWSPADVTEAERRGITPMIVLRDLHTIDQAREFLATLPNPSYVFSHPEFSGHTFSPELARVAIANGRLPRGAKVSKVRPEDLATLRVATGPAFTLWDGTARHIAASLTAGANGIVAAPLSHIPELFPARDVPALQDAIDRTQAVLDQLPDRAARTDALIDRARRGMTRRSA